MSPKSPKKSLSQIPTRKESEEFSKAHQNVLLERIEKNISVLAEGHLLLRDEVKKNHEEMNDRFEALDGKMNHRFEKLHGEMNDRFGRVDDVLVEILGRLKTLESRVEKLESKWKIPSPSLPSSNDSKELYQQLERRIAALEAKSR